MARQRGMTLWELIVTVAVAGVALAWTVPAFEGWILDARRTADVNGFVLAVQLARSEAAKRGQRVVLCKTLDTLSCALTPVRYDSGWMVFVATDDTRPPRRGADQPPLYVHRPRIEGSIAANREWFEFRAFGWRSTNGTVTFCDRRGANAARAVIVSYTGRPRVAPRAPGGQALVCGLFP